MQCPACQHENKAAARFCEGCGARLARPCPSCGEEAGPQARFCPACGATFTDPAVTARGHQPQGAEDASVPAGERRQLTVFFCDLVGSTPLSQQLDAEEWRDLIAQYQQAASGAVVRFGGHLRAEILLDMDGNAVAEAEALFGQSLEIARRQEAKTFELRAATSLARLWQRQGKRDASRALLAPLYAWLTEGFDTRDLQAAKALLAELR